MSEAVVAIQGMGRAINGGAIRGATLDVGRADNEWVVVVAWYIVGRGILKGVVHQRQAGPGCKDMSLHGGGHLACHRPLALQLCLVPFERLLSAVCQVRAVVLLRHAVLEEGRRRGYQLATR